MRNFLVVDSNFWSLLCIHGCICDWFWFESRDYVKFLCLTSTIIMIIATWLQQDTQKRQIPDCLNFVMPKGKKEPISILEKLNLSLFNSCTCYFPSCHAHSFTTLINLATQKRKAQWCRLYTEAGPSIFTGWKHPCAGQEGRGWSCWLVRWNWES